MIGRELFNCAEKCGAMHRKGHVMPYEEDSLRSARSNIVAKDNRLIQRSRYSLSLMENKALLYLISMIRPDDKPGRIYTFSCAEFQRLLNWNKEASYMNIKAMFQRLGDVSMWIESEIDGSPKDILVRYFHIVRLDQKSGHIDISFHEDMFPYLLDLQKHLVEDGRYFTTYRLQNVTLMKHRYSIRIYELLKSYQYNNQKWTFENGTGSEYDIQLRIAGTVMDPKTRQVVSNVPDGWSNWAVFRRNVLDPAVEEINKYTDIVVAYTGKKEDLSHKKTRAIRTIEFYMVRKTEPEQAATDRMIDTEYTVLEDEKRYHQVTVEEAFFQAHEQKLEEEKRIKEEMERRKKEQEITDSRYPVLWGDLHAQGADFTEKQVEALFRAAIRGRTAGAVQFSDQEMFATDFVMYYYEKLQATMEDTRTKPYNRLLDMVKKDYDGITEEIRARYARGTEARNRQEGVVNGTL